MSLSDGKFDLSLFLDQSLLERQNLLRSQLHQLLVEIANEFPQEGLKRIFPGSKGSKISKGNDLLGSPYWVLDLLRDFDLENGINIRLLIWWGKGSFLMVHLGKNIPFDSEKYLLARYQFALSKDRWDLEDLLIQRNYADQVDSNLLKNREFILWVKAITLTDNLVINRSHILDELKKIGSILKSDLNQHLNSLNFKLE